MAVEGSLDLFSLPEILQMISQQGKTGILTIQGQQDIVAISFLGGRIVAADSLAHTIEEGLSKLLVSEGLLTAAELVRAGAEHQAGGGRLLDLLVERRYLTRRQLLAALRLQTVRQLEALLRWQEGDFKFYGGDEVSYEEGFEPISVEDLLLRTLADFAAPAAPAAPAAGAAAAGARIAVPAPPALGGAAPVRRPAVQDRPESGELWLPQVPDLPEVSMPPAPRGKAPSPAAAAAVGSSAPAGPSAPAAPSDPTGLAALVHRVAAAAAPMAGPANRAAATPAAAAAAPSTVLRPLPPPLPEPLPWPDAALSPSPTEPPPGALPLRAPRPRPAGVGAVKAPEPAAAAGRPAGIPAGAAGSGPSPSPSVPPDAAAPAAPGIRRRPGAPAGPRLQRFRQMQVERPVRQVPLTHRLAPAVLAVAAAVTLAAVASRAPETVLLPFPWQQGERAAMVRNQRESLYDKIDGAAKTAFLRDGRFPDQLGQLRDSGLLSPADLDDPLGEPLLYSAREDSYALQATEKGKPLADADTSGSIAGNFLLDPTLLQNSPQNGPPIVLLD